MANFIISDGMSFDFDCDDEICLVILDLIMPEMDGEETFHKLREIASGVPILPSSGFTREQITDKLFALGAAGFLQKPFDLTQLSAEIQRVLALRDGCH